jgi:hypothetical protein
MSWVAGAPWQDRFHEWCRPPAVARLFVLHPGGVGAARAAALPKVSEAYDLFTRYAADGESLTLLLNRADSVSPEIVALRDSLGIGRGWRHDDVVATLSTPGSGIGYHAGHEDGFIVQLEGRRRWRAWSPECLTPPQRAALLWPGHAELAGENAPPPHRPELPPVLDVELAPGDAIYLPSLYPHDGETIELSVSLSIAWRGVAIAALLEQATRPLDASEQAIVAAAPDEYLRLANDACDCRDRAACIFKQVRPAAGRLAFEEDRIKLVRERLEALLADDRDTPITTLPL